MSTRQNKFLLAFFLFLFPISIGNGSSTLSQVAQIQKEDCTAYYDQTKKGVKEAKDLREKAKGLDRLADEAKRGHGPNYFRKQAEQMKAEAEKKAKEVRDTAKNDADKLVSQGVIEDRLAEKVSMPEKAQAYRDLAVRHRQEAEYVLKEAEKKAQEIEKKGTEESKRLNEDADRMEESGVEESDKPEEAERKLRGGAEVARIEVKIKEDESGKSSGKYVECRKRMKWLLEE